MRPLIALLALGALTAGPAPAPPSGEYALAVEFPYYLFPRTLWERELVWLKNIGVGTVEFSIPWNWHQTSAGEYDLTGRTSPRRDLLGLIRLLRRLKLRAWVRPLPPVPGLVNEGWPSGAPVGGAAQRAWLKELEGALGTQTASHGGPVAYVEGRALAIDAGPPPAPVMAISAADAAALVRSREAIASAVSLRRGAVLWTGVEDALYPAGWAADSATLLRKGAVGLAGEERTSLEALRRGAALLRNWAALFGALRPVPMPKPAAGKLPEGVRAVEFVSPMASAVCLTNRGSRPFHDELRVVEPASRRTATIPSVAVPAGESLWLPLDVSLGPNALCRECTNFSGDEHIIYATAELVSIEFENGILAMEFAAPEAGEAVLQLARAPVGPFLAAGRPAAFDWDEKNLRARLPIPAGAGPGHRVRIGIAMEEPETSGFFNDARRLVAGRANAISTTYSSAEVAARSRLRLPEGYTAQSAAKSPNEIDYAVSVPADAIHGDWANLALEADGVPLGRARLQLFRPVAIRISQAIHLHLGRQTELAPEPPVAPIEPKGGSNLDILLRNNSLEIQTYHLEAWGQGLEFFPPAADVSVGPTDERSFSLRVFPKEDAAGLLDWRVRVTGGAQAEAPMRALVAPRNAVVAWSADLDGDGSPEWVLESHKVRAVFSTQDGGRWMEFTWKDSGTNFLPEQGAFAASGAVEVRAAGDALEFEGKGWKRTVRLVDSVLVVEQSTALPPDRLAPEKVGNTSLSIERASPMRAVYTLK
jgi:hypothetical protein